MIALFRRDTSAVLKHGTEAAPSCKHTALVQRINAAQKRDAKVTGMWYTRAAGGLHKRSVWLTFAQIAQRHDRWRLCERCDSGGFHASSIIVARRICSQYHGDHCG